MTTVSETTYSNKSVSYPGFFITFEGADRSGKSTLIQAVKDRESELVVPPSKIMYTRQPGGTSTTEPIRAAVLHSKSLDPGAELLLFLADRREHVVSVIKPALQRGMLVLCDRYTDSTRAYQQVSRSLAQSIPSFDKLLEYAQDGLDPDMKVLLDISVEEIQRRSSNSNLSAPDRMESDQTLNFAKIVEFYRSIAYKDASYLTLKATDPVDANATLLINQINSLWFTAQPRNIW